MVAEQLSPRTVNTYLSLLGDSDRYCIDCSLLHTCRPVRLILGSGAGDRS